MMKAGAISRLGDVTKLFQNSEETVQDFVNGDRGSLPSLFR